MSNKCITAHFPELENVYSELIKNGYSDRGAAAQAALNEYSKLIKELNTLESSVGIPLTQMQQLESINKIIALEKKVEQAPKSTPKKVMGIVMDGITENTIPVSIDGVTHSVKFTINPAEKHFNLLNPDVVELFANELAKKRNIDINDEAVATSLGGEIQKALFGEIGRINKEAKEAEKKQEETPWTDEGDFNGLEEDDNIDEEYRNITLDDTFETEDWPKVEKWLQQNFPHLPIYRVKNIIQATNGRQAWGMLKNASIYLYENAQSGTVYHEVFEAVWKMFTSTEEQQKVKDEFRNREGSYTDRFTGEEIKYSEATDAQLKEELAEEFRDQMIGVTPKKQSFISKLFNDIIEFIKQFFVGEKAVTNTQQLFDKISSGYYKDIILNENQLSLANSGIIDINDVEADENSEFSLSKVPAKQTEEVVQHMVYSTLVKMIETNQGLFTIDSISGEKKNELVTHLYNDVAQQMSNLSGFYKREYEAGNLDAKRRNDKLKDLWKNISNEWPSIVSQYEQRLYTLGIQFDENDELALTEEEKTKDDPFGDSRKIDSFRKASSAVRMLLATLPVMENGKPKKSSIGGIIPLPSDKVFITLKNKLYDSLNDKDMFARLADLARQDENYKKLYRRLIQKDTTESLSYKDLSLDDLQLIASFWKTMKSQQPEVLGMYILPSGETVVGTASNATAVKQLKKLFTNSIVGKIKNDNNPFIVYNSNGTYSAKKINGKSIILGERLSDIDSYVKFLDKIGISFGDASKLTGEDLTKFKKSVEGIRKSLSEVEGVKYLTTKTLSIDGVLTNLANVKTKIDNPQFNSTYFNIRGEKVQTFIGSNLISNFFDNIKNITNISQLKGTSYEYLLPGKDEFVEGSILMKRLFDSDGNKREGVENILHPVIVEGTDNQIKGKTKESSALSEKERLLQEINFNIDGIFYTLVPGDSAMEHAQRMHEKGNPFITESDFNDGTYLPIFRDYFISEVKLARNDKRNVDEKNEKRKGNLRFFYEILENYEKGLHDKIMSEVNKKYSEKELYEGSEEKEFKGYKSEIDRAVTSFIKQEGKDLYATLSEYGIIEELEEGDVATGLSFDSSDNLELKLTALSANYIIANIENHKLIFSDPYQYSDELKRIKNLTSPKQSLINASLEYTQALTEALNKGFENDGLGFTQNKQYFSTVTMEDVIAEDPLYPETSYKEGDGGGMISMKAYRFLRNLAGDWTQENEQQYRYDVAYEKYHKNIPLSEEDKKVFDPQKEGKDNPGVKDTYKPLKPIAAGNKANGESYNDMLLDKFALFVLSYRIQHQLNPESNAVKLHNKWQQEGIDYGVFKTGRKVGAQKVSPLYSENEFNTTPYTEDEIVNVPFTTMFIQQEVPSKDSTKIATGSQLTTLATLDYMNAGVPIDFATPNDAKFNTWYSLTEDQKLEYPSAYGKDNLYKLTRDNERLLRAITENGFNTLLHKLGFEEETEEVIIDGKKEIKKSFKLVDRDKFVDTLTSEVMKQEVNKNIIRAFKEFKTGQVILEATPAYKQIKNILLSIADKNVVRTKITGGMKVQMFSSLLEANRIVKKIVDGKPVYTSGELEFYKDEDGKRVCEVMVGRWFKNNMSDGELLNYLNNSEEGQKILKGIAFRIPTQKQNSIDVIKVKKFLPKEFGDNVIVPSALVVKVGSDFDIDKLNMYFKNVFVDLDGKLKSVEFKGSEELTKDYYKNIYQEKNRKKLEKVSDKIAFKNMLLSIFNKLETVEGRGFEQVFPKLSEEEEQFYADFQDEVLTIQEKADIENVLPSEYVQKELTQSILKSDDLFLKLFNEEFSNIFAAQKYTESLQNAYIESLEKLIGHPLNFKKLTSPNSAETLEGLAKDINKLRGKEEVDYTSVGKMLKRKFMNGLRYGFIAGKKNIGIAAVGQTNNAKNQRFQSYVDYTKLDVVPEEDKVWLGDGKVHFEKFNKILIEGKGEMPTLSFVEDVNGEAISEILSQVIDGSVDVSKHPWIIELGITPSTASTWLFLIKIGVPVKTVAFFMNQPIILDYLKRIRNRGYSWLFIDSLMQESLKSFKSTSTTVPSVIPSKTALEKMVRNDNLTDDQKAQQQFILKEFTKYSKMASHLFLVVQGSNFDTANMNDTFLIFKKFKQLEKAKNSIISSVDDLINSSYIESLMNSLKNVREAYSEVFISEKGNVKALLEKELTPYINLSDRDFVKVAQKVVADLFDWAVQTNSGLNKEIAKLLIGKDKKSAAQEIIDFKNSIIKPGNENHYLYDNIILNSLSTEHGSRKGKIDNITLTGSIKLAYDQNLIIAAFQELKYYMELDYKDLYEKLVGAVILQSGLTNSPIALTQLLPYEDFKDFYNSALYKLETLPLDSFHDNKMFVKNNWSNSDIVEFVRAKLIPIQNMMGFNEYKDVKVEFIHPNLKKAVKNGQLPKIVNISTLSQEGKNDYITYQWEERISKSERIIRNKTENRDHVHKVLMQKVYYTNTEGNIVPLIHTSESKGKTYNNFVYVAINALGDSFRAKEFYTDGRSSVLDNEYDKIEKEVSGDDVARIFFGETPVSQEKPVSLPETKNSPEGLPSINRTNKTCKG